MSMYDESNAITLGFDPSYIVTCMDLWRKTVDLEHAVSDDLKVHLVVNRRQILSNYEKTSSAWKMLLGAMRSQGDCQGGFLFEVCGKVEEFNAWAKTELAELNDMAVNFAIQEGFDELMSDPETRKEMLRLKELLKRAPGGQDGSTGNN